MRSPYPRVGTLDYKSASRFQFLERQPEKEKIRLSPSAKMSFNVLRADNIPKIYYGTRVER